jgi:hypothetical protein
MHSQKIRSKIRRKKQLMVYISRLHRKYEMHKKVPKLEEYHKEGPASIYV